MAPPPNYWRSSAKGEGHSVQGAGVLRLADDALVRASPRSGSPKRDRVIGLDVALKFHRIARASICVLRRSGRQGAIKHQLLTALTLASASHALVRSAVVRVGKLWIHCQVAGYVQNSPRFSAPKATTTHFGTANSFARWHPIQRGHGRHRARQVVGAALLH